MGIIAGTGGGQLAMLASAPIVSRLYRPADVGVFSVLSALALIIGSVSALRFDAAIPLPEREDDAHSLVALGLASATAVAVASAVAVGLLGERIEDLLGQPSIGGWLFSVPVIALTVAMFAVLNQLAIRERRYAAVGRRNLLQGVTLAIVQVVAGIAGFLTGGMILGFGAGQAAGASSLAWGASLRSDHARAGRTLRAMRIVGNRYRRFPLLLTPSGLLNILGLYLPVVVIAKLYGGEVAGWFGMSQQVLVLPMSLIGISVAQVFLGELAHVARTDPGKSRALFMAASKRLAAIGAVLAAFIAGAGPFLFTTVLGGQWTTSGVYAQVLAVSLAFQLLASPLSQTLTVYERQWTQLAWDAIRLAVVISAIVGSWAVWGSPLATVGTYAAATSIMYALLWLASLRTVGRHGYQRVRSVGHRTSPRELPAYAGSKIS